jgi:acyl-coenzyme A thioesterase PaaI-like protein
MPLPDDARQLWITTPSRARGARAQKHQLVEEAKKIVERVALLDTERVGEDNFAELIEATALLAEVLDHPPSLRERGGLSASGGDDCILTERSGISGRSNPLAPPIEFSLEGDVTRGHAVWGAAYEGPQDCVHGGFVAAAFDDLLGCAQMASGIAGFTGTLTVKMIKPTPLYRRIDYAAGVDRTEGRKIFCWGTAHDGDKLLAEAQCVFIAPAGGPASRPPE